jgi:hypothetical protein
MQLNAALFLLEYFKDKNILELVFLETTALITRLCPAYKADVLIIARDGNCVQAVPIHPPVGD